MAKKGRPKKPGDRYPCGQLKDAIAPTLAFRSREYLMKLAGDPSLGSEGGRLFRFGRITAEQYSGVLKYAEVAGRAAFYSGGRRYAKSPSYELGFRGAEGREGSDVFDDVEARRTTLEGRPVYSDYELRAIDAEDKYVSLKFDLCKEWTRTQIEALERVCIDDEAPDPILLHTNENKEMVLCRMLNSVAASFGTASAPKKNKQKKTNNNKVANLRPQKQKPLREMDYALAMMQRLRPDLEHECLLVEWNNFCALRDRDHFRNQRNNRLGAI